jgi:hypothetical protein
VWKLLSQTRLHVFNSNNWAPGPPVSINCSIQLFLSISLFPSSVHSIFSIQFFVSFSPPLISFMSFVFRVFFFYFYMSLCLCLRLYLRVFSVFSILRFSLSLSVPFSGPRFSFPSLIYLLDSFSFYSVFGIFFTPFYISFFV